jgi:hypothetical protein
MTPPEEPVSRTRAAQAPEKSPGRESVSLTHFARAPLSQEPVARARYARAQEKSPARFASPQAD